MNRQQLTHAIRVSEVGGRWDLSARYRMDLARLDQQESLARLVGQIPPAKSIVGPPGPVGPAGPEGEPAALAHSISVTRDADGFIATVTRVGEDGAVVRYKALRDKQGLITALVAA